MLLTHCTSVKIFISRYFLYKMSCSRCQKSCPIFYMNNSYANNVSPLFTFIGIISNILTIEVWLYFSFPIPNPDVYFFHPTFFCCATSWRCQRKTSNISSVFLQIGFDFLRFREFSTREQSVSCNALEYDTRRKFPSYLAQSVYIESNTACFDNRTIVAFFNKFIIFFYGGIIYSQRELALRGHYVDLRNESALCDQKKKKMFTKISSLKRVDYLPASLSDI